MKNLIATAGCALVIGLSSTFAQQDSTRDREQAKRVKQPNETNRSRYQRTDETRKSSTNSSDQNQSTSQNQSNTKREMVIVQPSEIPSSLRETLADPKYQGWESAVIYHNTRTGEYLVSPRPHRFNSEGKEVSYDMTRDSRNGKSYGQTGNQNRSSGSVNQHRRTTSGDNSRTNGDDSNVSSSTNQNQDSTRMNRTQSSSSSSQDRERSGQSSSYRRDSTQMNRTNSSNSQDRNSDRSRSDSSRMNGANNSNASSGTTSSNNSSGTTSSNNSYTKNRVEDKNLPTEGMVLVEEQDVPAKLKETLRDSDYSGWERGKLYQNPATGEYILVMGGSESGNDEQRSYRFDKDGKVIKDSKMNGRGQE
jgi:hypothetical protein